MRASVIAIPAADPGLEADLRAWGWEGPVWRLHRRMEIPPVDAPVLAFCGIARPHQFFAGLEAAGLRLAARVAFRDHHPYTARDLGRLQAAARAAGAAALVTTAKDQVRLAPLIAALPPDLPLLTASLRIEIEEESAALDWLVRQARRHSARTAPVRKSLFAHPIHVPLARGPAGRDGRRPARSAGGHGSAPGPSRLGHRLGRGTGLVCPVVRPLRDWRFQPRPRPAPRRSPPSGLDQGLAPPPVEPQYAP